MQNATIVPPQKGLLLVIALIASLVMLDSNVVAVALPTIARTLNADFADVQWVITAYVLPFSACLLVAGAWADLVGRRCAALTGLALFGAASLACGLAASPTMLNIARAIQGEGASLVLTSSLALLNHLFRGEANAHAFAFWGASLGIAISLGPIVGGVIASLFGWTWAFLINVPICSALFFAAWKMIPESRDPDAHGLDYPGILTFSSGLFLLTWAIIDGNTLGWSSAAILAHLGGGGVLLAAFVAIELHQRRPMIDCAIFRSRHFLGTVAAMVGYAAGSQVMIFYLPLYLQTTFGFSPMVAGLSMLPFALPMFLVPRLGARIRLAPRTLLCAGLGMATAANLGLAWLASTHAPYLAFGFGMLLAGGAAGLLNGDTAKALQGALPENRLGVASGIAATTRFVALLLSVAALGAILVSGTVHWFAPDAGAQTVAALAKRYAAGDVDQALSPTVHAALQAAFAHGFSLAVIFAALTGAVALMLTWWMMDAGAPAPGKTGAAAVLAGE